MSLLGIIGQLQSIQPTRRDATAQTLALDLTKARNSILMMARLLQNSGRTQSNQYVPNQANSTKRADTLTKEVRKTSGNLERLSGDQKRFKAFVQQTVNNIDKQLRSFRSLTKRNENMLRSVQSEIGLGRPQRAINYAFGTSAAQVPSYGRNIKSQLNRLSQQINVLNSNQQRMIREGEREAEDRSRRDMGIIGGRPGTGGAMRFTQKLGMLNAMARKNLAETQLPGMSQPGRPDITQARLNSLYGGLALYLIANVKGEGLLEKMFGKELADNITGFFGEKDWQKKIKELKEGTPYKLDGTVRLKGGKSEPDDVKEINAQIDKLKKQIGDASGIDTKAKDSLLKQIQELEKQRLQFLKESGIITQEHVKAGLAKPEEISYYENKSTAEIAGRYIPKEVVAQYPEIYTADSQAGTVQISKDYKEKISKLPDSKISSISSNTGPAVSAKDNTNTSKVVVYRNSEGQVMEVKEGGTLSWRNNNPGNIKYGANAVKFGAIGDNGGFAIFPDYKTGKEAMRRLLTESGIYKNDTIWEMIGADGNDVAYAPKSDNNNPIAYAERIQKETGIDVKTAKFAELSLANQNKVLLSMIGVEGYGAGKTYRGEDAKVAATKFEGTNQSPNAAGAPQGTSPVASLTAEQTATMTAAATQNAVKVVEDNSAETQALMAQQTEVREQKVDQDIVNTQGVALAADMKVNKLYRVVEKNTKEINSVREYVRVATGASDFSVRNPILDKSWNV